MDFHWGWKMLGSVNGQHIRVGVYHFEQLGYSKGLSTSVHVGLSTGWYFGKAAAGFAINVMPYKLQLATFAYV